MDTELDYSDRGPQFASAFMWELCGMLKIRQGCQLPFIRRWTVRNERVNQALEQYLRLYISGIIRLERVTFLSWSSLITT